MSTFDLSTAHWRKSSHSGHEGGNCVEVADLATAVAVRDSKNPDGPTLILNRAAFTALAATVRAGAHDL
ncbi:MULTISPECIES: DUF397 domain-containing protein [Thermomonosporaceae]|uniref:DUF397 domain-containing protein n=1 Tax=Thermomonosporaceae TaxID=2012 RepID=UPI00255AC82F|nr:MULTISPECIES: DUF397 domain-containing protein [Thermomonosporaceae]MDL4775802.1 DUF397 domain-containing protein [Actinomadura xylanilytica]